MKFQIAAILSIAGSSMAFNVPSFSTKSTSLNAKISRRESLGSILSTAVAFGAVSPAFAREEYLTEPTEAFKESERQRDEFRRNQLLIKKKFNLVLDRLTFESKTADELVADLKDLQDLVISTEGLPLGVKKDEMVKIIRAKKAKGFWPTEVEYAYQALIREIAYQQSPNRDKDLANPL